MPWEVVNRWCWQNSVPHRLLDRGLQFFDGSWPWASLSSLSHDRLQHGRLSCEHVNRQGDGESLLARCKSESLELIFLYLSCILLVRTKSPSQLSVQVKGIIHVCECQEEGITGDHLRCIPATINENLCWKIGDRNF